MMVTCMKICPVQVGRDSRDVMRAAYAAFQEGSSPDRILQAADARRPSDAFYANLVSQLHHSHHVHLRRQMTCTDLHRTLTASPPSSGLTLSRLCLPYSANEHIRQLG